MKEIERIGFVGSGNVATQLAKALFENQIIIDFVISRNFSNAKSLADRVGALALKGVDEVSKRKVDLIIISVGDQEIKMVGDQLAQYGIPLVHTSGATPRKVFAQAVSEIGVFYPLQTMTRSVALDFSNVPICIDGSTPDFQARLQKLAGKLSEKVYMVTDEQREWLHLSAVLLNNNINHLLARVNDILEAKALPAEILQPLLLETVHKASKYSPKAIQTGPAIREDDNTKLRHLKLLEEWNDESLTKLYKAFWDSIQSY
ncbi:MAG: DUF2520 domain-containing protein [Bacteroidetes bacterium]|nr:DUF2520 domain-containing protein [Bacteroidota bacterium]